MFYKDGKKGSDQNTHEALHATLKKSMRLSQARLSWFSFV